ncbi:MULTISPECIES: hypothetical protein [unclassified Serratia (in: enterobacteria)]|uniref:hypothetical protein n=1 Tax=unclassified Serratia (in: enterobacteria) TaxID=2647522 RepID=UPI000469215A|nr:MULTISPECIES: hypothetical protein [unclassified Serratia (in: enterobacteria)]
MVFEKRTDLEILQERVGATEVLLRLLCKELSAGQKSSIAATLDMHIEKWKGEGLPEEIFKRSKDLLNKDI